MNKHRRRRLQELIDKNYEGDRKKFCDASGTSESRLAQLLSPTYRDGQGFGERAARTLEKNLGLNILYFDQAADDESDELPSPTDEFYEIIPQLDLEASCGNGKFTDYVVVKGGLSFKRETLREWGITPKNGRIIYASGQSMEPTIGHGRVVLINMDDKTPQDGRVYLICDGDSAMLLKRLVREFDTATGSMMWKMRSDNPDKRQYADKPLPDHSTATIVGRAVWHDGVL